MHVQAALGEVQKLLRHRWWCGDIVIPTTAGSRNLARSRPST